MKIELGGDGDIRADLDATPTQVVKATIRAMNKALASGYTEMGRLVAQDAGIKVGDVKKHLIQRKAAYANPRAELATRALKRMPLIMFNARQTNRGVTYGFGGGVRRLFPGAFITHVSTGHELTSSHEGVFTRVRPSARMSAGRATAHTTSRSFNLPIKQRYGASIGHIFDKFRPKVVAHMQGTFTAALEHELQRTDANA